jgi:hypothetical protein
MNEHWKVFPPVHIQVYRLAAYFGVKQEEPEQQEKKGLNDFIADFMAAGGRIDLPKETNG